LLEIGRKTQRIEDIQGQYTGLLKFTPPAWQTIEGLLAGLEKPVRARPARHDRITAPAFVRHRTD
jgi:hypothetical protein